LDHVCKIKIPTEKAGKAEKAEKIFFFQPHWDLNPQLLTWPIPPSHHHAAAKMQSYQIVLTYSCIILPKKALGKCFNISLG
jgi:hypothetical protein